jgi:hypothetical protein
MSNDSENPKNMSQRGNTGQKNANRPNDTARRAGQESQDALRHQQDAAHHKGHKTPQRETSDSENDQLSQNTSRNHSDGM